MNLEKRLLAAFIHNRKAWADVHRFRDKKEDDFSPIATYILECIDEYYNTDTEAQSVNTDLLGDFVARKFTNPKHTAAATAIIASLPTVSGQNVVRNFIEHKRTNIGLKLSAALAEARASDVEALMDEYTAMDMALLADSGEDTSVTRGVSVIDIVTKAISAENRIKLAPKELQQRTGGALRGHHIVLYGRPESGKTAEAIELGTGFSRQGLTTLYVGNEDPIESIQLRFLCRMSGKPAAYVQQHPAQVQEQVDKQGYGNIIFASLSPGTFREVRELCLKYEVDTVILDQLRNMNVKSEGRTQQLEKAAIEARNLAKSANVLVVSVTQAGDSAEDKTELTMGDVDGSNTGIPAQADLMIGLGHNALLRNAGQRCISMPKNKLSGDHTPFIVDLTPQISRIS